MLYCIHQTPFPLAVLKGVWGRDYSLPWTRTLNLCRWGEPGIFSHVSSIKGREGVERDHNCVRAYPKAQNIKLSIGKATYCTYLIIRGWISYTMNLEHIVSWITSKMLPFCYWLCHGHTREDTRLSTAQCLHNFNAPIPELVLAWGTYCLTDIVEHLTNCCLDTWTCSSSHLCSYLWASLMSNHHLPDCLHLHRDLVRVWH